MQTFFAAINEAMERKVAFLGTFFIIFTLTYAAFASLDALPEPIKTTPVAPVKTVVTTPVVAPVTVPTTLAPVVTGSETPVTTHPTPTGSISQTSGSLPKTLTIDALGRTLTVLNPASRSVSSLDTALLSGVVRHPDSAELGENGNIFILGHSSYLPIVHNKNYQAFNGIQNLKWGDTIRLDSSDTEYTYRVEKVYKAKATALVIPIAGAGQHLTLATCNSFGTTDDRFIVEATLLSTKPL